MLRQPGQSSDSDNERLYTILEKVDAVLTERRTRQTLVSELLKAQNDIEFLENKISTVKNNLQKETPELETIKTSFEKVALTFSNLTKERETAEAKYFRLKISEKDFNAKIALLPKINAEIVHLGGRIGTLKSEYKAKDIRFKELVSQKTKYQKEISPLSQKIDALTVELPLIRNTKDIILGLMPPDFDQDSYAVLQGDFEKNLNNYTNEISQEIKTIGQRVADLKVLLEKEKRLQSTLSAEKADLDKNYNSILADTGGETEKSMVMAALNQLGAQKSNLITESDRLSNVIDRIKSENNALDEKLEHENTVKAELVQRYAYLTSIKQELDGIDDVDAQIRYQEEKNRNLAIEVDVLNRKIDFINKVNHGLDAITDKLQYALEDLKKQWIEFVDPLNQMLL